MVKKTILIDMDGVIVNLGDEIKKWFDEHPHLEERYKTHPDHIHGIFRNPKPIDGAIAAINKLIDKYEVYIATAAPWGNPDAASDKRYWIEQYFGNLFHKKMIVTHKKNMIIADYLIDDSLDNGAFEFKGELLRFGVDYKTGEINEYPTWNDILNKLLT
jgi:5'(3')-deoxyribonucleotidase